MRLHRNPQNLGLFGTLNRLLDEARAPVVRLLAQDDRLKPFCLDVEAEFWSAHPSISMSYEKCDFMDEAGATVERARPDRTPAELPPWLSAQMSYFHGCLPATISTVSIRKAVVQRLGGFDPALRVAGDWEMWTRLSAEHTLGFIDAALVDVRRHPAQLSRQRRSGVAFIRESGPIVAALESRLPAGLLPTARRIHRGRRVVQYFHHAVRLAAAGELRLAREALRALAVHESVLGAGAWWLWTCNGRRGAPAPVFWPPDGAVWPPPGDRPLERERE